MPWLAVTDETADSVDTLRVWAADPAAFGLDMRGRAYCAKHLTDGVVPAEILELWIRDAGERDRLAQILVDTGCWERHDEGFYIPIYLEHNPTRARVMARRKQKRAAAAKGGKASGETRRRRAAERSE